MLQFKAYSQLIRTDLGSLLLELALVHSNKLLARAHLHFEDLDLRA